MYKVSASPHIHGKMSVSRIMWNVNLALLPLFIASILFFGMQAFLLSVTAVAACLLFQSLIEKFILKVDLSWKDGSAVITGMLLAFNLPSNLPLWMVVIGSFISIVVGKMAFGGLGKNPFNPALVGRVFLLISFPTQMTLWPKPNSIFLKAAGSALEKVDATTGPTLLASLKQSIQSGVSASDFSIDYVGMFIGEKGGSLGEISILAILLGGVYLLLRRIVSWHIPVSFIGSAFIFASILYFFNPELYINPTFHILTGGLMLGAFFMATDMVTSPMSARGQLVFGAGCGVLTILIRVFGAYPEGVSFAILFMNALVPLINRGFKPQRFSK